MVGGGPKSKVIFAISKLELFSYTGVSLTASDAVEPQIGPVILDVLPSALVAIVLVLRQLTMLTALLVRNLDQGVSDHLQASSETKIF